MSSACKYPICVQAGYGSVTEHCLTRFSSALLQIYNIDYQKYIRADYISCADQHQTFFRWRKETAEPGQLNERSIFVRQVAWWFIALKNANKANTLHHIYHFVRRMCHLHLPQEQLTPVILHNRKQNRDCNTRYRA